MFKKILKVFMTLVMVISVASFHINNVEADSYKYEESRDVFVADCIINGLLDKSGNRADTYSLISSTILHNYTYKTLAEALMDDKTLVFNSAFWTTVNNSLKGEFSTVFQQRTLFYETIIMDYLAYVDHSEEFESSFNQDRAKYEYDISKKLIEFANDNYENNVDEIIKNQSLSDAIEFSDKYGYISKLNKFSGLVDSIKEKATSAKEYYDGLKSALAIENANVSRVAFLKQMKGQAGDNTDFCDAVDEIVGLYEGNYGSLVLYGVEDTAVKHLTEWAWKKLLVKLPSSVSATLDSIKLGQKTLDFIFNSNDTAENNLKLLILYIIGSYARESATHLRALFNGAQTATNGSNFVNGYLEYVIYQKYATELASGYVQESTYDGLWNQIKNSFNGTDTTYEQFKKYFDDDVSISKNYIKQVVNYYNLHNSYYGDFSDKSSEIVGSGTSSNMNWNLNGNGVLTITGTGKMPDYGSSDQPWYKYKEDIRRVIINEGITSIGNYAFYKYYNISKVTISNTVTSVGYAAFAGCTSLIDVTIPKTVTTIGDSSFANCTSLESVVIEANSKKGFETVIRESAFNGCKGLTGVTIPGNVTSIGSYAFSNCKFLEELTIPEGVKSLGYEMISNTSIESITIPNSVTSAGEFISGNELLTEVIFKEGRKSIPNRICYSAINLKSVTIPSTVTNIEDYAFKGCTSLTDIVIPKTVTKIGCCSFEACSSLESVMIEANNKKGFETVIDQYAFNGCKSLTSITIPSNVISIENNAFMGCKVLEELIIPEGVKSLGSYMISGTSIESITIPNSVTSAGEFISGNELLTEVIFKEGRKSIPDRICYNAINLKNIAIPSTVTSIEDYAFKGCTSLTDIVIPKTVTKIGCCSFEACSSLENVTIEANNKKGFETVIDQYAFNGCKSLTSITIPSNVISIENNAFMGCKVLEELIIPEGVKSLGSYMISGTSIESITIPNSVTSAGEFISGNELLTEVIFKEGRKSIPDRICYNAINLKNIAIPSTVTSIEDYAFKGCTSLTDIVIPKTVTKIGCCSFEACSSLENVTIEANNKKGFETVIDQYAFNGCKSLTSITIPGNVTSIGNYAFSNCNDLIAKVYNNSTGLTYCKNNKINYRIIGSFNKAHNIEVQNGTCTNIDESTELKVNELKEGNDYDVVSKSFDNFELYDIAFYKDDQKVTIDGTAIVRIPVEEGMDGNKCKVYYNDNGTFVDMGAIYKDGFMEFKTDHFSQYVITDSDLPTFTLGDVNEDGKIDFLDAITVLRHDAEIIQLTDNQMKAAEVNKDSKVDFLDAITILRYDAEIIDSFN